MKLNRKLIAAIAATCLSIVGVYAQTTTVTPYSKFGYGILHDNATSSQRAMGGVGYAMNSGRQINVMNPASYAFCDSLTFLFDMGVNLNNLWSEENGTYGKRTSGGLDYITLQFPVWKNIGMSVGLLPYSTVGYSFGSAVANGSNSRVGDGGINQLYAGIAWQPVTGLSAGVNFSYMFGNIINDTYAYTSTGSTTLFEDIMEIRDWQARIGLQYSLNIGRKNRFTVGVSYVPGKDLRGKTWGMNYDINADTDPTGTDTISLKGHYSLAETWGAGLAWEWDNRLTLEADYTFQNWEKAKYHNSIEALDQTRFTNRHKMAFGAQYRHSVRGSWFKRIQWRVGYYKTRDYIMVGNNNVNEYGLTCGFGLPTPGGNKTMINLAFEYLHRQTSPVKLIGEQYFNITLGVNINELWFMKNKLR